MLVHRNFEGRVFRKHVIRIVPDESRVFPGFIYAFLASEYGQIQIQATHSRIGDPADSGFSSSVPLQFAYPETEARRFTSRLSKRLMLGPMPDNWKTSKRLAANGY